jgi:hypothetical protein
VGTAGVTGAGTGGAAVAGTGGTGGGATDSGAMDGGDAGGDTPDSGTPDAGGSESTIPDDGSWLSICDNSDECEGDDLVCYGAGGGNPGFCSESCDADSDCQPIDGFDAECSTNSNACRVICDGPEDTDCPTDMECRGVGGMQGFYRCLYPPEAAGDGTAGQWESCNTSRGDADCQNDLVCYRPGGVMMGTTGYCTIVCTENDQCTAPEGTTAPVLCGPPGVPGDDHCLLDCSDDSESCPEDMQCGFGQSLFCRY